MPKRQGYILLTVLLLLMLAAVVMASLCRLAIGQSLQAAAAGDELQRRWGTVSCRDVLLPNAANILDLHESSDAPLAHLHSELTLGGAKFSLDICDEQAKANVNTLYALEGRDRTEQSVKQLARAGGSRLAPRLRLTVINDLQAKPAEHATGPEAQDSADAPPPTSIPPLFGSWSEVFPDARAEDLFPNEPGNVTRDLTCWGNGSLNLRRASLASITQMCGPALSPQQIAQVIVLRNRMGDSGSVDMLLQAAHVKTEQSLSLYPRISLVSAVHSLWIVSRDHSAIQRSLFIRDGTNGEDVRMFSFEW